MIIRTLTGSEQGFLDGRLDFALFDRPTGLGMGQGALYVADTGNHRARHIDLEDQRSSTILGNGLTEGAIEGEPSPMTPLNAPHSCVVSPWGEVHICETMGNRVWRLNPGGWAEVVAGTGTPGSAGDGGPARSAQLDQPMDMAFDDDGNLYIAELGNDCLRMVSPDGWISRLELDNLAKPRTLCFDPRGALFIGDGHRVLRLTLESHRIDLITGSEEPGYGGDGGPARDGKLNTVTGLALDQNGNLLIVDQENARIRLVNATGTIQTVAGNGQKEYRGDGADALDASFIKPYGITIDEEGKIYVSDEGAHCIRVIE